MTCERENLIIDLTRITENKYELNSKENLMRFTLLMLKYIGDIYVAILRKKDGLMEAHMEQMLCMN